MQLIENFDVLEAEHKKIREALDSMMPIIMDKEYMPKMRPEFEKILFETGIEQQLSMAE
jgi:hypothetical protein